MQVQTRNTTFRGERFYNLKEKVTDDQLKRGIRQYKDRARYARNLLAPRSFPDIRHQFLIEAQAPGMTINEDADFSSRGLTDWYVKSYCRLNHLKEC